MIAGAVAGAGMFGAKVEEDAILHAMEAYPEESCGLVIDNTYFRCQNVSNDCLNSFQIADDLTIKYGDRIQAVIHSHTEHQTFGPSSADMSGQAAMDVPWGLVITNGRSALSGVLWWGCGVELNAPLIGRQFIHGIYDCGSIIRSYYWQERGVVIKDFPRDDAWWKKGGDIYREHYAEAGFVTINQNEVKEGDVFLAQVRSPVPNHGGIYVGNGLILHHLELRPSRREPAGPWANKMITHWLRYSGEDI